MKKSNIVVLKFGGTSMGTAESIKSCAGVIIKKINEKKNPFVVVSAMSKITDSLLKLLNSAKDGKKREISKLYKEIIERHFNTLTILVKNSELKNKYINLLNEKFSSLTRILDGIVLTGDCSEKMQANILSYGEELSSLMLEAYLIDNNINSKKISSRKLVKTSGNYLSADLDFKKTKTCFKKILNDIKSGVVFIMTGFFGSNVKNEIMLLGRGGSDFSGSIAGISLNADAVEIWTDVDGVMSADPRLIKTAKSWEKINKDVASEMARAGAKVLHPKTILASHYGIDILIKNSFNKSFEGTLVNSNFYGDGVRAVVSDDEYSILHIENQAMFNGINFIAKIGSIASENNIPIDMTATSETSFSFTIKSILLNNKVKKLFDSVGNFSIINNTTKISIVGENIASNSILELAFKALKEKNIEPLMLSMGQSKNNIGIIIKTENKEKALLILHEKFIK